MFEKNYNYRSGSSLNNQCCLTTTEDTGSFHEFYLLGTRKINMNNGDITRNRIRDFIIQYVEKHGYSPTFEEIGIGVGLKSKSSVSSNIKKMLATGMIETDAEFGTPRAIRVPGLHFTYTKETK